MNTLNKASTDIALLSSGFRPFFLGAAAWAAITMVWWLAFIATGDAIPGTYGSIAWHAHELLFGYSSAVIAGFLLTAVPNWTSRPPIVGYPLLSLYLVWLAGRVALPLSEILDPIVSTVLDSAFLFALSIVIFREIAAARDLRNYKIVAILFVLALTNLSFHVETQQSGFPYYSLRAALSILVTLIALIGGRIIPNFTRNWLSKREHQSNPATFNWFDRITLLYGTISLTFWTILPFETTTAVFLILAGLLHLARLARWKGYETRSEPLLLILHIAYAFIPVGFLLVGYSTLQPSIIMPTVAVHAWTTGAIGLMTIAVMTRVSRGHSGHPLTASRSTRWIYIFMLAAILSRLSPSTFPALRTEFLLTAAFCWICAFTGFIVFYGPILLQPRRASDL